MVMGNWNLIDMETKAPNFVKLENNPMNGNDNSCKIVLVHVHGCPRFHFKVNMGKTLKL